MIQARLAGTDGIMVRLDQASGHGGQAQDREFWKMDGSRSITARERM
jgi:hypothetical protein